MDGTQPSTSPQHDSSDNLPRLKARFLQIGRLDQVARLLTWDQQTYLPPGAVAARAEQAAAVHQIVQDLTVSQETERLLSGAEADLSGQDDDCDEVCMLRNIRRQYDFQTMLPASLLANIARHQAIAHGSWQRARAGNDFQSFAPALEKMLDLTRQGADCLGYTDHIYDAVMDIYEPGMKYSDVAAMFADLKPHLVRLVHGIASCGNKDDYKLLHGHFPVDQQMSLTKTVVQAIGYDLNHGRVDEAAHPFCCSCGREDVRIATRFDPAHFASGLYASIHEAGHAMYDQGIPAEYENTALGGAASIGWHESQSRLWENLVGRSRSFCGYIYLLLRERFPESFAPFGEEALYRAVNRVKPSPIRVDADEVTYNIHVLIRFELESELLAGSLRVADLPAAWNSRMEDYLGITPETVSEGVLQDLHWSGGLIGYFPTYSIGNIISGQLWHAIQQVIPDVQSQIRSGEFAPILEWLRTNVHSYAQKYHPAKLIVKATGEPLSSRYYVEYLNQKYSELYGL